MSNSHALSKYYKDYSNSSFTMSRRSKIATLQTVVVLSLLPLTLDAFEQDFPPYPDGKFPPVCKIHPLQAISESDRNKGNFTSTYWSYDKGLKLALQLDMDYQKRSSGVYLRLKDGSGKSPIKPVKIGGHPSDIDQVYWGYLNKDDHKDYIVTMNGGDGYLSGGRQKATFLLSMKGTETKTTKKSTPTQKTQKQNKPAFSVKSLGVYSLKQQDFYDYSTDNKCEFLHQALVGDSKNHYWVYNVLQFIDGKIVINNRLSRYFPKWLKLTAAANVKPALLTPSKKKELSKKYIKQIGGALK